MMAPKLNDKALYRNLWFLIFYLSFVRFGVSRWSDLLLYHLVMVSGTPGFNDLFKRFSFGGLCLPQSLWLLSYWSRLCQCCKWVRIRYACAPRGSFRTWYVCLRVELHVGRRVGGFIVVGRVGLEKGFSFMWGDITNAADRIHSMTVKHSNSHDFHQSLEARSRPTACSKMMSQYWQE